MTSIDHHAERIDQCTRVTLLLCARLMPSDAPKPLSLSEYHHLCSWVGDRGIDIVCLLSPEHQGLLAGHPEGKRIIELLRRSGDVDEVLRHWSSLGIWVMAERDPRFPQSLRSRLKSACLPLLFGAGPAELLNEGGLCVVGSRDCTHDALEFARAIGARAGAERLTVISSDMRGVDREVLATTLREGGRAICVVSDSLERAVASRRYREALETQRACMITPFSPDTHFAVANAMRAHRYQYGLSDAAIVVETRHTGGVWSGAEENRKHRWVPAFVRIGKDMPSGNAALLHLGLFPLSWSDLRSHASFSSLLLEISQRPRDQSLIGSGDASIESSLGDVMFALFIKELRSRQTPSPLKSHDLSRQFGLEIEQVESWLNRAQAEGLLDTTSASQGAMTHRSAENTPTAAMS